MIARQWLFMHFWWHWDFEAVRRCSWRGSLGELANVWMRVGGWSARPRPSAAGVRATCSLESGDLMAMATVSGASRQNDVESRELRLQGREKGSCLVDESLEYIGKVLASVLRSVPRGRVGWRWGSAPHRP